MEKKTVTFSQASNIHTHMQNKAIQTTFSQDYKFLTYFAFVDNGLSFWQRKDQATTFCVISPCLIIQHLMLSQ